MQENKRVADMAEEILVRQAKARAERTGEPRYEALKAVLKTEAGQQLERLREGPYRDEQAQQLQYELAAKRAKKLIKARQEEEHLQD